MKLRDLLLTMYGDEKVMIFAPGCIEFSGEVTQVFEEVEELLEMTVSLVRLSKMFCCIWIEVE